MFNINGDCQIFEWLVSRNYITFFLNKNLLSLFVSDVDNCQNVTCDNGGSCVDGVNEFRCMCIVGFSGEHCETGLCQL